MNPDQETGDASFALAGIDLPGFGLVVVWPRGRKHDSFVLDNLAARYEILEVTEVTWTPELTETGYARFSQTRLDRPHQPSLLEERGVGSALVIALFDPTPSPSRLRSEPVAVVSNRHFMATEATLAERMGKGQVHVASDTGEAVREYMLLLERSAAVTTTRGGWMGKISRVSRDLAGTEGWADSHHMFAVLNSGAPYVVLRNYEGLADLEFLPGHKDIDILTADYVQTVAMLGAESRLTAVPRWGGRFDVRIGSRSVICDLRFPGDDYYEPEWAWEILRTRRLHQDGFYVPDDDELLDTMLYHAVVQKPEVRRDYQTRLEALARDRGRPDWKAETLADRHAVRSLLFDRLDERGFSIRRPRDPTVFFNHRLHRSFAPLLWRLGDALRRRVYRFTMRYVRYPLRFAGRTVLDRFERPIARLRDRLRR